MNLWKELKKHYAEIFRKLGATVTNLKKNSHKNLNKVLENIF